MVFFSTYDLYKQGTSQVVTWLANTATRCGYEHSSESGKARNNLTQYKVSIKELPVMAKVISENFRQVSDLDALPRMVQIIKDVIIKRREWAKKFGLPDPSIIASNMRHKHFVAVLEEVNQILRGVMSALHMGKAQGPAQASISENLLQDEKALNNLFEVLTIEEIDDQEEGDNGQLQLSARLKSAPATTPFELKDELDEEELLEEIYFRIHCFFQDFVEIRKYICHLWVNYSSGRLDLPAVAVATNVALEILQRAEKSLLSTIPNKLRLFHYKQLASLLVEVVAANRGVDSQKRLRHGDVINMELKDIADFTCLPVYILLSSFLPVIEETSVPVMKPGHFGSIDLTGQPLSWREKFDQDKIVLLEFLPEFCLLDRIRLEIPGLDELSRGLIEMIKTKDIPMWLVLGCQIYLDIHHTMLSCINTAHKDLQIMGLHVSKSLQRYLDFSKEMSIETWPKQNDMILQLIKLEADLWVNRDFFATAQQKIFANLNLTPRPYSLLSRHPLLCGTMLFRLNLRLQEAGSALVCAWGALPTVIHLYNAVKQEIPNNFPLWQDVEAVIKVQGKERIFVGDFPKDVKEYLNRFCLVMGYSASIFAANRRQGRNTPQSQTPASKRGPREMIAVSSLADVFRGQYCENDTRSDVTFHKIDKFLAASSSSPLGEKSETKHGANWKSKPFIPVSFLQSLQSQIQSEILALNLDYFALHICSINLLRDIYVGLDSDFRKYLDHSNYLEKESQLPFLVGYLFLIASNSSKAAQALGVAKRNAVVKSAILMKAGGLVKDLIAKEGSAEVERIRRFCRGLDRSD